jgi:hypothetical protein
VEVITSAGIAVHPPRLHRPVPSTIPVLGSSSHVERGPVIRQPVQTQPQSGPPSAVPHGPPGITYDVIKREPHGLSLRANYFYQATAACRRS